jgi:NADPH:quinone reductase-like Zn-dependent oxidoreductase
MHAIVFGNSGELKLEEIDKPGPADGEVLLKVRAASVNPLDYHFLRHPFLRPVMARLTKVKTLRPGRDVAGQVEAVGKNVTQFKIGDEVFGACNGAFAEYACARESAFAIKPSNVSFEQAASVPVAALTALQDFATKHTFSVARRS